MASKKFEELKERLRALKTEQAELQVLYQERASQRLEYQNKMANLNLMLQNRSFDTMLIEDVIVVTLVAENDARERYSLMPPPPTKTPIQVEPGQKTKSLEEACNVYRSQIEVLEEMIEYRRVLTATERDLDLHYRQAVDNILDIMEEYCDDEKLTGDMLAFAAAGSAPCSPRKGKEKSIINRMLWSPKLFSSPKKEAMRDSMHNELLPVPLSVEPPETPKSPFTHFKDSAQFNELKSAPLIDLSDNDDDNGDNRNGGDMLDPDETAAESPLRTERRKKKKINKQLSEERDNGVEMDPDDKKKTKKKKLIGGVTTQAAEALASSESAKEKAEGETELIEKKKKKKKKKQEEEVTKTESSDVMIEGVPAEASLEDLAEKAKEKKKKKKQKEGIAKELEILGDKLGAELESDKNASNDFNRHETPSSMMVDNESTEDDNPPPLIDDEPIDESQESPKKKKKKKIKDNKESGIELTSEKVTKKKKTKDKETTNGDASTTSGQKTAL